MRTDHDHEFLTSAEVKDEARVSSTTLLRWRQNGTLPAIKVGGRFRYRRADVEALLSPTPPSDEQATA